MASPLSRSPVKSSPLIGVPVRTALSEGTILSVSGKLQQILVAELKHSLLARPGVMSDSWITHGMCRDPAARTTGTLTKPPLEKTTSGLYFLRNLRASL